MKYITALENGQRRTTKLIPGFKDLEQKERLQRLKLPTLSYVRHTGDMVEMHDILRGKYDLAVLSNVVALGANVAHTKRYHLNI